MRRTLHHEEARRGTKPCGEVRLPHGFAALRGQKLCRMASCYFVALRGEESAAWLRVYSWSFVVKMEGSRACAHITYTVQLRFLLSLCHFAVDGGREWGFGGEAPR